LTHPVLRTLLRLRLIIQTSLLGYICAKVPEVQEDSILADHFNGEDYGDSERTR